MIRVAMLSYWHVHAWDYTKQVQGNPDTEIVAVWDEFPTRGEEAAQKLGVPFVADLDALLARADVDAVVVDTPTNIHRDVMVKAARAGKHIFTEKVIAPTLKEVQEILGAVDEAGVKLTVSLPRLNHGYTLAVQEVIDKGLLGQLTQARARLSHNGATAGWLPGHFFNLEQCGGGALIDLGCHPMYLVRLFLGLPQSVSATYGYVTGKEVEDNAVATLSYDNGAVGIVEAGFVNSHSPFSIELHGTEGTLLYGLPDEAIRVRSNKLDAKEWVTVEVQDNRISAFDQWVGHILNGSAAEENIGLAVDLTKLMEASNRSAAEKRSVNLTELAN
ncbi:Gfo/Idh/MocA family oxidoreductase [Paenibacillus sp. sptzw28]|uniref:Gfo/Idh/MocA family protein n=1 Tax=Paenibacillus sp. sptzw28 TaxID=715179 RepID=UPI001C6EB961|nr:Gfo/Idh/MocA family oxidoreductase [Paenibacillus sp. sptzw28]QYR20030.1 Gfo/Idh/MocA family oxidoreductase [Paenibacillus sp. sptzw28]